MQRRGEMAICRTCGRIFVRRIHNQRDCCLACHYSFTNRQRRQARANEKARRRRESLRPWALDIASAVFSSCQDTIIGDDDAVHGLLLVDALPGQPLPRPADGERRGHAVWLTLF